MPPVKVYGDQNNLRATKDYPHAHWPYETFNPPQSRVLELYDRDSNCLIAAATSAGKTTMAEMYLAHEIRVRGGKGMYLGPLKALTQEKIDDWVGPDHHFNDANISICTGDYRLTKDRRKELVDSDLVIMTTEMLNCRCRNYKSENNDWMKDVGTIIIDESHLLTVPGRGDHLEAGLMKFTSINPNARIIMLSATMPNVKEIAEWVAYSLTNRETDMVQSDFRPCKLNIHYERYYDGGRSYQDKELSKVGTALNIVQDYPDDKFLVFVHTKGTGHIAKSALNRDGVETEFHNADLSKEKRIEIQNKFKDKGDLRCLAATSTLAWGCNLPARRVVVTGVHRGLSEVANYDILQMIGRAGRVGLDPMGDAYILLPESKYDEWVERLQTPEDIKSQMLDQAPGGHHKVLAFHIVSEIHHGGIKTLEDVHNWYERSLAHFQNQELHEEVIENVMSLLTKCGAIKFEKGKYTCTAIGKISSMFYYSPFDVADLKKTFNGVFNSNNENNDLWVSMALGNTDTHRMGIVSKAEREEMSQYAGLIKKIFGSGVMEPAVKAGYAYFNLLNGRNGKSVAAIQRNLQIDFPRTAEILLALDSMACKWGKKDYFKKMRTRMVYGVEEHLVNLCGIPNVGKVRATKLYKAGLKTPAMVVANPEIVKNTLNMKEDAVQKIIEDAAKAMVSDV